MNTTYLVVFCDGRTSGRINYGYPQDTFRRQPEEDKKIKLNAHIRDSSFLCFNIYWFV